MSAENLFLEMKAFVDASCKEKNYSLAVQAAEKFGFVDFPASNMSQVFADLRHKDLTGAKSGLLPGGTIHLARFKISPTSTEFVLPSLCLASSR